MISRRVSTLCLGLSLACLPCSIARAQTYAQQVIADGAIHYWRFEETSTDEPAKDEIPSRPANGSVPAQQNNPGVYEGGVTLGHDSAYPALGKAAHFDEQNGTHVLLGEPQHPGNSISIEAWILLDSNHTVGFSPIIARWDGSYELDVNHQGQGGELDFVIRNDFNDFLHPHSAEPLEPDVWHHVVGIFAGESDNGVGTAKIYLDGVLQECPDHLDSPCVQEVGGDLQDAGGDDGFWYIGRTRNPDSGFAWLGLIDEVAIYPFELTQEQINNHIELATKPVVAGGDFDGNGTLDAADIELLSAEVRAATNNPSFDLNADGSVDQGDRNVWVSELKSTWFGDANLDGLFNTSDLVTVFTVGKFETGQSATWAEGDWSGDGLFGSSDLVRAFQDGGFEAGPRAAVAAVPEPTALLLTALGLLTILPIFRCPTK